MMRRLEIRTLALLTTLVAASCGGGAQVQEAVPSPQMAVAAGAAHSGPTFYGSALPALQRNCVECHRVDPPQVGGITAPMALDDYHVARRYARRIQSAIETGYMPPWGAHVQHKGTFKDERYMDEADREAILDWIEAGTPEGDPALATVSTELDPSAPESGWWIGEPDLVVSMAEPIHVHDTVQDWQPTIHMPLEPGALTEPQWISKAELAPGGPWVHHIVSSHMGVGVPGRGPFTYPEGWGVLLPEDPFITVNMHYHKDPGPGTAVEDLTQAAFTFYQPGDVIDYVVDTDLNFTRDFVIPPGDPNYKVEHTRPFEEDSFLLSMGPHMHYRGKAVRYDLEYPDGTIENLLWVPNYNFDWQFLYEYEEPRFIPAGSQLHMTWWFDNSDGNPHNPDPTAEVVYGQETTDEMANARIYFAPAVPRGIVVGEEIPPEILERAREREERRRAQLSRVISDSNNN